MENRGNNIKRGNIIGFCVLILIGVICYFGGEQGRNYVKQNGMFTILTIDKVGAAYRGKEFTYHYRFKGKVYKNASGAGDEIRYNDKGKRIFLRVIPDDPSDVLIYVNNPVPSWFTLDAPPEGWKTMPTTARLRELQNRADSIRKPEVEKEGATDQ